ncbi:5-methylcytosine-specific restriction enzyme subunit McrC [Succinivibrio dextrinosolvens DSM 3072]|uniref:5-methylcytosine-specific restriction enzyme subunit McrC n=1 Tax=Succinivibrio dextrinosolvens DSM 3072 TaxID=1123324 RepID=A0A1T4UZ93_9GAMM|nr:McrC family protein [Succinivibrio dextrinosolvens]SKA58007.1 5-methylcytosine-specific restriction enzyme subunit McrC [Succinivibrio dextrinosolvens DSM 3072]
MKTANNITVSEFDIIHCNENIDSCDSRLKKIDEPVFNELVSFINEYNSSCEFVSPDLFLKIERRLNIGNVITVKGYVGVISLKSGIQIEILPKIDLSNNGDYCKTRRILVAMLQTLRGFNNRFYKQASLNVRKMNIFEIFISMYLNRLSFLTKQGLKSGYITEEDNLKFFRGRLLVSEHLKTNLTHKEKFYLAYDEFSVNCAENRLIKSTLLRLKSISRSSSNLQEIIRQLVYFENIDESHNLDKDFNHCSSNDRNYPEYNSIIEWSKIFLQNKGFTSFTGGNSATALLFEMNKIFEGYVTRILKKEFENYYDDIKLVAQDTAISLFDIPRPIFKLKPDIVIKKRSNNLPILVMDTKWKTVSSDVRNNYGLSQADMYQMYAYGKKYNVREVWLIYPTTNISNDLKDLYFESNDNFIIRIKFFDLSSSIYKEKIKVIKKDFIEDNELLKEIMRDNYN